MRKKEYKNPEWFKQGAVVRITQEFHGHDIHIGSIVKIEHTDHHRAGSIRGYVRETPDSPLYWITFQECEPVEVKSIEELLG